jgi:hypothetical protein
MKISDLKDIFSSKNNKCNCLKFNTIENNDDLEKRIKETAKIISNLRLIEKINDLGTSLYECEKCGQQWQESLSWMHGNSKYVFKVPKIEIKDWKEMPYIEPNKIFLYIGNIQMYFNRTTFEEKEEKCKKDNCYNQAIKLSVLCILHQMESIGIKLELPSGYRWFNPYEKEKILINMTVIKEHPNYKELKK